MSAVILISFFTCSESLGGWQTFLSVFLLEDIFSSPGPQFGKCVFYLTLTLVNICTLRMIIQVQIPSQNETGRHGSMLSDHKIETIQNIGEKND